MLTCTLALSTASMLGISAGCSGGGETETIVVQEGNTTRTLVRSRELRPIDLREGRAIADEISRGTKKFDRLTTEERRQLNAFVVSVKKPKPTDDD